MALRVRTFETLEEESLMPALRLVESPRPARRMARWLVGFMIALPIALLYVPWQQNVKGSGQVVALDPRHRPQPLEATVYGRIVKWHVYLEGTPVKAGQKIVEIADIDPEYLRRLEDQVGFSKGKVEATEVKVAAQELVVRSTEEARRSLIEAYESNVTMAREKVKAATQDVNAANAALEFAVQDAQRQRLLERDGLASTKERQAADQKYQESNAKVVASLAYLEASKGELASKEAQLKAVRDEYQAKVDYAKAALSESRGDLNLARKELADIENKLSRQQAQVITAPVDGTLLRLAAFEGGEIVKPGDRLAFVVPGMTSRDSTVAEDRAVELYLDGNDAPLVNGIIEGEMPHVRLQFEGWPAVQFAGWPSVAIGTFGGRVKLVDATDNGKGKFRIVVVPDDPNGWPSERYLRQGVRAKGWVLLRRVTLGFELWRRLNGFPPVVTDEAPFEKEKLIRKLK